MIPLTRSRRIVAAATTLLALLAVGCGSSDHGGAQANPSPESTAGAADPSTPTEQQPPQPGRTFTAIPDLVNTHPIAFGSWSPVAPNRIAVNFQIGSPDCYGVDQTTTETPDTVTVHLRSGELPQAVGRMCTMIAVFGTLEIPLKSPLGTRKVSSAT